MSDSATPIKVRAVFASNGWTIHVMRTGPARYTWVALVGANPHTIGPFFETFDAASKDAAEWARFNPRD